MQLDGRRAVVEVPIGESVMYGAVDNGIPGIRAQCGGGLTCSTCHARIDPEWIDRLEDQDPDELELLDYVETRTATSRLTCQIFMTPELDGLVVYMVDED